MGTNVNWEFMEMILKELPSNLFFKDTECRYLFATHYWRHIDHDDSGEWSIRGKTDLDIRKDKKNALLAYEQDKKILETGIGCRYIIEECQDGETEYLEVIKNPVRDKEGHIIGIVGLINNVTDRISLQKQLEAYAQTDTMTGLYNRRYLRHWTEQEVKPHLFPVSIISADCDGLKATNDMYGHFVGDEIIRRAAQLFKTELPDDAVLFRMGGDEFLLILPGTSMEQAQEWVNVLRKEAKSVAIRNIPMSISYGICTLEDDSEDFMDAVGMADKRMYSEKLSKKAGER